MEKPPESESKSLLGPMFLMLVNHGVILLGIAAVMLFVVPKFHEIFRSFDTELPTLTVLVLGVAQHAKNVLILFPALAVLLAFDAFVYYFLRREVGIGWGTAWWWFVILLEGAAVLAVVLAVFLPLMVLMGRVGESAQ